ncbi:proline-rich protein 15 [Anguilla anguilla]|uniref:proline-rich protein 15 n=1 Tax=Anguilla anguilla TaxID=7936 RepID=UPI0015B160E0|nr:proline-rich protein 15 [Anguilla anguilla]
MADRTSWWKSFTIRKKGGTVSRDPAMVQQDSTTETQSVEPTTPAASSKSSTDSTDNSRLIQNETYDDSECEPAFNDKRNIRNMSISRSGRFKERRKKRATLAENNNFYAGTRAAAGQEGLR